MTMNMLHARYISYLVPFLAGLAGFLWYTNRRKKTKAVESDSNQGDESSQDSLPVSQSIPATHTREDQSAPETVLLQAHPSTPSSQKNQQNNNSETFPFLEDDAIIAVVTSPVFSEAPFPLPSESPAAKSSLASPPPASSPTLSPNSLKPPLIEPESTSQTGSENGTEDKSGSGSDTPKSSESGKENGLQLNGQKPNDKSQSKSVRRRDRGSISDSVTSTGSDCDNWRQNMGRKWEPLETKAARDPKAGGSLDASSEISVESSKSATNGHSSNASSPPALPGVLPSQPTMSRGPAQPVVYEFEFPSELCGRLIGKGGRNLHQMMTETNTKMALRKQSFRDDHQIVTVQGRNAEVQMLLQSIRHKFPKHRHPNVDLRPVNLPLPQELTMPDLLPLSLPEGVTTDCICSTVISAGHVFLQLPSHPTYPNLPRLDACMLACYSQPGAPPLPTPVEAGAICAAPLAGMWYRAQVVQLMPEEGSGDAALSGEAYLRFVDYGGYSQIPCTDLRQIRSDFVSLPFQGIECYLGNISPSDLSQYNFSLEGALYLEELCKNQVIQVEVVAYAEDGVPYVHLYKPQGGGEARVLVNRALVDQGSARWVEGIVSDANGDLSAEDAVFS